MTPVLVPLEFLHHQGKMIRGDFYWVDVILKNGVVYKGLTTNGTEILGNWDGYGGGSSNVFPPFKTDEIMRLRPHTWRPFREQLLKFFQP